MLRLSGDALLLFSFEAGFFSQLWLLLLEEESFLVLALSIDDSLDRLLLRLWRLSTGLAASPLEDGSVNSFTALLQGCLSLLSLPESALEASSLSNESSDLPSRCGLRAATLLSPTAAPRSTGSPVELDGSLSIPLHLSSTGPPPVLSPALETFASPRLDSEPSGLLTTVLLLLLDAQDSLRSGGFASRRAASFARTVLPTDSPLLLLTAACARDGEWSSSFVLLLLTTGTLGAVSLPLCFASEVLPVSPSASELCSVAISTSPGCSGFTTVVAVSLVVLALTGDSRPRDGDRAFSTPAFFSELTCPLPASFALLPPLSSLLDMGAPLSFEDSLWTSTRLSSSESELSASLPLAAFFFTGEDEIFLFFLSGLLSESLLSTFLYRFRIRPPLGDDRSLLDRLRLELLSLLWLRLERSPSRLRLGLLALSRLRLLRDQLALLLRDGTCPTRPLLGRRSRLLLLLRSRLAFTTLSRLLRRSRLRLRLASRFQLLSLRSGLLLLRRSRLLLLFRSRLLLLFFSLLLLLLRSGLLLLSRLLLLFRSLLLLLFRPRLPLRFLSRLASHFLSGLRLFFLSRLSRLLRSRLGLLRLLRLPPLVSAPRFVSATLLQGRLLLLLGLGDALLLLDRFLSCKLWLGLLDLWDLVLSTLLLRLRPFSEGEELREELGDPLGLLSSTEAFVSGLTLASCAC